MKKKSKSERPKLVKQCDDLWREIVKAKGICEICVTGDRKNYSVLQAHHIIGRKNLNTRWDLRNGISLCPSHHTLGTPCAEYDYKWFDQWLRQHRPEDSEYLDNPKLRFEPQKKSLLELDEIYANLKTIYEEEI